MSHSKKRPMRNYSEHWVEAVQFLAASKGERNVVLERSGDTKLIRNLHTRARSMRCAIRDNPEWPAELKEFVHAGRLRFKLVQLDGGMNGLLAYSIPDTRARFLRQFNGTDLADQD